MPQLGQLGYLAKMIPLTAFAGKPVWVVGLGVSGLAAATSLAAGGAQVGVWDDSEGGREAAEAAGFAPEKFPIEGPGKPEAIVLAPGIPLTHPEPHWSVAAAKEAGIAVIGDTELFFLQRAHLGSKARVIGITGTNGKSTTTALTAHLLRTCGFDVEVGGNIGEAVLGLQPFEDDRIYVIEFSSYQLDLTPSIHPTAAAILNVTPDHLDRHGTFENYLAAKASILQHMGEGDTLVLNVDDQEVEKISDGLTSAVSAVKVSARDQLDYGVMVRDGQLIECGWGQYFHRCDLNGAEALQGEHNWQNAGVAWSLSRAMRGDIDLLIKGFQTFPGLVHRMEIVGRVGTLRVVNDSKGTNLDATARALSAYDRIYWIAGGRAKDTDVSPLKPWLDRVERAYLIGECAEALASELASGDVRHQVSGTMRAAVGAALEDAERDGLKDAVLLLSPACASFDQYRNFELRGDDFKACVIELAGERFEAGLVDSAGDTVVVS